MIIPLTREIIDRYYDSLPATVKGFAAVKDDVIGIMGVYSDNGVQVAFSQLSEELKKDKRLLIRLTRKTIEIAGKTVYAIADPVPKSEEFLEHWGFEQVEGDIWARHFYR